MVVSGDFDDGWKSRGEKMETGQTFLQYKALSMDPIKINPNPTVTYSYNLPPNTNSIVKFLSFTFSPSLPSLPPLSSVFNGCPFENSA
ncbi:unnamed protein product [Prunus armeniaca]|uniref:Uncharacterized protein n=1 Tax=Prunus armeniaca TaxID=36596 RepID=A0A6J5WK02_PRUAR|nr:unnamed protein product [Prunus armeniaca]